eukprot:TRINITY_DN367_c0_g2_i2.p1 TRINITY_DN367_c0_g2~~TRINITY_DN367_c0_g2_i2.p1  ORF type:complete len:408 (-),score=63.29 TRINITY_DN367_c0_g2_i2:380-1603(-)
MYSALNKWKRSTGAAAMTAVVAAVAFGAGVKAARENRRRSFDSASTVDSTATPRSTSDARSDAQRPRGSSHSSDASVEAVADATRPTVDAHSDAALPMLETHSDLASDMRPRTALVPIDGEPVVLPPATRSGNARPSVSPGNPVVHNSWTLPQASDSIHLAPPVILAPHDAHHAPRGHLARDEHLPPGVRDSSHPAHVRDGHVAPGAHDAHHVPGAHDAHHFPDALDARHTVPFRHDGMPGHKVRRPAVSDARATRLPRSTSMRVEADLTPKISAFRIVPMPQALPGQARAIARAVSLPAFGHGSWRDTSALAATRQPIPARAVGGSSRHELSADDSSYTAGAAVLHTGRLAAVEPPRTAAKASRTSPPKYDRSLPLHFPKIADGPGAAGLSDRLVRQLQSTSLDWR